MKWIEVMLYCVLLGIAGTAISSEETNMKESLMDYAAGVMLETSTTAPWYRVALPQEAYQNTRWPDLRDIRIFNQQGDPVPFALVAQKMPSVTPEEVNLRLFSLDASPVAQHQRAQANSNSVVLRTKNNIEILLPDNENKAANQSYLLMLPEGRKEPFSLAQLRLNWPVPSGNWQGKATVYVSDNLRDWRVVQKETPLMDLTGDKDHLKIDTLTSDLLLSPTGNCYLLVILSAQSSPLVLSGATAIANREIPQTERIVVNARGQRISDEEAIWQWPQPQPLTSLHFELTSGSVLPVELAWRRSEKEPWQVLTKTMLYHLDDKHSEDTPLSGQWVEAIRLTTINARLPEVLPQLSGTRDSYQLLFNAQGKEPYMLAWGNGAATKADIAPDKLIPPSLGKSQEIENLPQATAGESIILGGETRLTATSAGEQQNQWKVWLVWGVLISGVAVLLFIAWRVWQEVKKTKAI